MATTTVAAVVLAGYLWFSSGVSVTVHNSGSSPLVDLKVSVTGKTHELGDLANGATKQCLVKPTSDSHVEISYRLPDGTIKHHSVDCYLESGARGAVNAEVRDGVLIHTSHQVGLSPL